MGAVYQAKGRSETGLKDVSIVARRVGLSEQVF
jgi:hypothetical protein